MIIIIKLLLLSLLLLLSSLLLYYYYYYYYYFYILIIIICLSVCKLHSKFVPVPSRGSSTRSGRNSGGIRHRVLLSTLIDFIYGLESTLERLERIHVIKKVFVKN
jgi:hypothetical protein